MMTIKEIYRIWAPVGVKWSAWVRPVPFVGMGESVGMYNYSNLAVPSIGYAKKNATDTAVIVDLPGVDSVTEGLGLAKLGFRPIPVFNGTISQQGARETVDNQAIAVALKWGAAELERIELKDNAMPAFLLDKNRLQRFKMDASIFDNSWDVYPQDMPTAEYLLANGINRVLVINDSASRDLKKILREYKKKKIKIEEVHRFG